MFIEKLEEILRERGSNISQLSKETGIKQQTMSSWKDGRYPGIDKLITIAETLGVSADYLLEIQPREPDQLTPKEKLLIEYFRQVEDDTGKDHIIDVVKYEASRAAPQQMELQNRGESSNSKIG